MDGLMSLIIDDVEVGSGYLGEEQVNVEFLDKDI